MSLGRNLKSPSSMTLFKGGAMTHKTTSARIQPTKRGSHWRETNWPRRSNMSPAKIHEETDSPDFRVAQTRCEPSARVAAAGANRNQPDRAQHRRWALGTRSTGVLKIESRFDDPLTDAEWQASFRCRKRPVGS